MNKTMGVSEIAAHTPRNFKGVELSLKILYVPQQSTQMIRIVIKAVAISSNIL